jgi:hypothetical protein
VRKIGIVLVGLGAFFLVVGLMVRFYVYPSLAVAPANPDSVTSLEAKDATVFDIGALKEIKTDLAVEVITIGDTNPEATEGAPDGTVVWISKSSTRTADGKILSRSVDRAPTNEVTGEAVNCCGAYMEVEEGEREAANREGLVFKFPFNTQKQDYKFWDASIGEATTAVYKGTEDVKGLETYVFEQVIEPTIVSQREVPKSLVDEPGEGNVIADRTYSNKRTFYIDPNTGGLVNRTEQQYNTFQIDGEDRVTLTDAFVSFTDKQIQTNVDTYSDQGGKLALLRNTLPLVLGILGAILLLLGAVLGRRKSEA